MEFQSKISTGSRREQLEALRDLLADRLAGASASATAPIARELAGVLRELGQMSIPKEGSKSDELAAKRAARRSAASQGGEGTQV